MTRLRIICLSAALIAITLFVSGGGRTTRQTIASTTTSSWNPAVSCVPVVTTIEAVIGTQTNSYGGATQAGGWYGGLSIPYKTSLTPPCTVNGAPMFVEIHNVTVEGFTCNSFSTGDGDCSSNLWDNSAGAMTYLNQIHVEIAGPWITAGIAPSVPPTNSQIDIQGFVYWDDGHTTDAWHSYSGWELHPVSAWRPTTTTTTTTTDDFSLSVSPASGSLTAGSSVSATIATAVIAGSSQQVSLSASGLPTGATATFNPSSLMTGGSSVMTLATSTSTPKGTYAISVTATGSSAGHNAAYTVTVRRHK
jgi:hypothetical protein